MRTEAGKTVSGDDRLNMRLAVSLAKRGIGNTHPNPAVGCILVRPDLGGRIVGRGWTQPGGRPHAETEALRRAGDLARGATAYVSLEPCSHTGKTPPCADALIKAGVARVVVAIEDPDDRVAGSGIARLQTAGLTVLTGPLAAEASEVNAGYLSRRRSGRPWVTLKLASSIDGRIATRRGESQWITSTEARSYGHALRARHDAILTGSGTVIADDPALTCRLPGLGERSPIRVVMTGAHPIPETSRLAREEGPPVRVFGGESGHRADPATVLGALAEEGINSVLIEGGAVIASAFLGDNLVDEVVSIRAPILIGGDGLAAVGDLGVDRLSEAKQFRLVERRTAGPDTIERFRRG
ncbi:MAG: bifunctional diaminohydroxyphosphoribosylaminopyrimidine deaminase/5-amino-6-(5-phosphoribosylamino)uracil reductase RibD [Rhodospirillales bacterium]